VVIHDLECEQCELLNLDTPVNVAYLPKCPNCLQPMSIIYSMARSRGTALVHASERAVVFRHPGTGSIAYPGVNNRPMPKRYAKAGYEKVEMDSLHKMDSFCTEQGVSNEQIDFNSGNDINNMT
jgi:hypothetical protein